MPGPTEINPAQRMRLIGTPDAPVIHDVRRAEVITDAGPVVLACQRGRKLSAGVAAALYRWARVGHEDGRDWPAEGGL